MLTVPGKNVLNAKTSVGEKILFLSFSYLADYTVTTGV